MTGQESRRSFRERWVDRWTAKHARPVVFVRIRRGTFAALVAVPLIAVGLVVYVLAGMLALQSARHDDRVDNERRVAAAIAGERADVRQLACIFVSQVNEDAPHFPPDQREKVREYRAKYGCPPYSRARFKDPFGVSPTPAAPRSSTAAALPRLPRRAESRSAAAPTRTPAPAAPSTAASATRTAAPTVTVTPTPPRLLPTLPAVSLCVTVGPVSVC